MEPESLPKSEPGWMDFLAKAGLLALPTAYISGYLAWAVAIKTTGLFFIQGSALRFAALGGMALLLSLGVLVPLWAGLTVTFQLRSKGNRGGLPLGLTLAGLLGGAALAALAGLLITVFTQEPAGTTQLVIGVTGLIVLPLFQAYVLWIANSDKETDDAMRDPAEFIRLQLAPWAVVVSIISAGVMAGAFIAPNVPATLGGLGPERAVIELDLDSASMFGYLINRSGTVQQGDSVQIPVWLFPDDSGDVIVRHACDSRTTGAAYTIPSEAVRGTQWITETTRANKCSG